MAYTLAVAVLKSTYHLAINPSSVIFIHASVRLRFEKPVSRAASHIFHYQDNLILSFYSFV